MHDEFFKTGLTRQQFLDEYWQKKPLLIRGAFVPEAITLTAEELAGLACEEGIESRIIEEKSQSGPWQLRHGPFSDADFAALPSSHWTLLVQDVDKHLPEIASVLAPFRFIPNWRRDDLMVSYAAVGGSVGPHTDGYDVFLLQALGTRRWQISDKPIHTPQFLNDLALKILAEFEPDHTWDLEPGDMLYLPPLFAHHGVAQTACMTFSIGFRAPSQVELLDEFVASMAEQDQGAQRYSDAKLAISETEYQLDAQALQRFKQFLIQSIEQNEALLLTTLGKLLTETKPSLDLLAELDEMDELTAAELDAAFHQGNQLIINRYQRFVWYRLNANQLMLFVAGEVYSIPVSAEPWLETLCDPTPITVQEWGKLKQNSDAVDLLSRLIANGHWFWDEDD